MSDFRMPSLGADMDAGTLVRWLVAPGADVHRGQVVAEVETAKGVVEVEIWQDGVVDALVVAEGTKVPVGTVLATLRERGAAVAAPAAPAPVAPAASVTPPAAVPPAQVATSPAPSLPRASPAARRRAHELDVELTAIAGTGPHGAISIADIERAASAAAPATPAPPSAAATTDRAAAMRQAIAAAMARSKREIPHYYLTTDVDMGPCHAWLATANTARPVAARLLPAAVQLKAIALALRDAPSLHGHFVDGALRPASGVHVGVAISLRGGGLVAPAIHDADRLSLDDLMRALSDLTERARRGSLRSSELTDATITVTSLGEQGVESVLGVIYPPQVALVGIGKTTERPWAIDGLLGVRPVVTLSLAADHRASDGHLGARFLSRVAALLRAPEGL